MQKGLEVILFTTEGTEHAEKMIKDMFYLPCLLCGKKCFVDTISLYAAQNKFKFTGCESWAEAKGPRLPGLLASVPSSKAPYQ